MKGNRVGEKYTTNEGYEIEIVRYVTNGKVYEDVRYEHIKNGGIKNPYHPSVYGIGFIGKGEYRAKSEGKMTKRYDVWHSMMLRCYSSLNKVYRPSYSDCRVDERWHNFQVFAEWFDKNYKEGYDLDKDLLIKGNKIYSPETCCFLPPEVNTIILRRQNDRGDLPIGVTKHYTNFQAYTNINKSRTHLGTFKTPEKAFQAYKKAKEKEIKDIARVCKNILDPIAYQALINYKIEITD